jgi:hypothetical protein
MTTTQCKAHYWIIDRMGNARCKVCGSRNKYPDKNEIDDMLNSGKIRPRNDEIHQLRILNRLSTIT